MTWIAREIVDTLRTLHRQRPALLLTGSRQVGKTSLLERTFADHRYASLDLPAIAEEAETAGEQFLERHPPPLILDEVQYAPKLFRYLKHAIDRDLRLALLPDWIAQAAPPDLLGAVRLLRDTLAERRRLATTLDDELHGWRHERCGEALAAALLGDRGG